MSTSVIRMMEAMEQVKRSSIGHTLKNVSDEPVMFFHNGIPHTIPPTGPWQGPSDEDMKMYAGTLEVRDIYGVDPKETIRYRRESRTRPNARKPSKNKLIVSGRDTAAHALEKLWRRGIILITGDPEIDEKNTVEAKERWIEFKKKGCEQLLRNYQSRVSTFFSGGRNQGQMAPSMSDSEEAAQIWLDQFRLGRLARKKYVCQFQMCGFQANDQAIMDQHMKASHPMACIDEPEDEAQETPAPEIHEVPKKAEKRQRIEFAS